jgi:DNA-binding MarR family transcriptional regulator
MAADITAPSVPEIDEFLHELVRLKLLAFLSVLKRADFVYLLRHSGLSRGNLSVQMTKLAEAGIVDIDKSFVDNRPRTVYTLTAKGRAALASYKAGMSALLDALPTENSRAGSVERRSARRVSLASLVKGTSS